MKRYYLGLDWADQVHQLYVGDEAGQKVAEMRVEETVEGMGEFGRWLDQGRAEGTELWAAIEKPEGRIVDFLLDHGVVVYPVNPKAVDRARDRFRMSRSKSDCFDAWVLSEFLRTDHSHFKPLRPNSEGAQELKIMSRDHHRLVRHRTRLLNQLRVTLKEYYPRVLELFEDLSTETALDFLEQYRVPKRLSRKKWERFAREHSLSQVRRAKLWEVLKQAQLPMPEHVVRAKSRLVGVLVEQLRGSLKAVGAYEQEIERFFACMPAAKLSERLPGGKGGTTVPSLWAELGDAVGRWESFGHLQAQAGAVPVTRSSGKSHTVGFRFSCNKHLRRVIYWLAFISLTRSDWARAYYQAQRARGHGHQRAIRALGAKWLKILFIMWRDHTPYDETHHLANIARQQLCRGA